MYTKQTLKNGLTVLKVPIRRAKSVLVDVFVKTGSRQESTEISGISHFLEHLFFKGSKAYPTARDLSHALDAIGAEYNANTGKEHTQFYIKAAKKHLKFIFGILTDMLQRPIFAAEEIRREKGVIIEEINMYQDTPIRHVEDVLEETMWPAHPLGRNIAGKPEVVRKISRQDIRDYVKVFYQPANMILAVAGGFEEKLFNRLIRENWANLKNKNFPAWQRVRDSQTEPRFKLEYKQTEQCHIALGFRSYDQNHPRYFPQIVLATILGGGMSSRLFVEIRERRGWAYYVKASTSPYQDTGNFVIQAGIRKNVVFDSLELISRELGGIKNQLLEQRELLKAKEYLKGTLTLSLEATESLLGWFLEQVAFRKRTLEPELAFELIDKVTAADVQTVANEIFQNDRLNLAIVGQNREKEKIRRVLRV